MVNTFTSSLPLPQVLIKQLKETQQNPCYHAEGNVLTHTLMVLENVLSLDDSWDLTEEERYILYWAAILHDIGKPEVTKWEAGRFHSHGHEEAGVPIARDLLLQRTDVSDFQRRQILDLVRWHSIPLQYGLRKKTIDAYKQVAVRMDIRLLGIFSFCDLTGRICQNYEEVKTLIMNFNQDIVPRVTADLKPYQQLSKLYQASSQRKKDKLWAAVEYPDSRLLEQIISSEEEASLDSNFPPCYIPIGVRGPAMQVYLRDRFPDIVKISIDVKDKAHLHNAIFTRIAQNNSILFEGDFTKESLRQELVRILREKNIEVNFLFFESSLSDLLKGVNNPKEYAEIMQVQKRLRRPHNWEAHKTEYLRLSR